MLLVTAGPVQQLLQDDCNQEQTAMSVLVNDACLLPMISWLWLL
jgi:hypothetical protein